MRVITTGLLLAGLVLAAPAKAQDAQQLGLGREVLTAMKATENFDALIPTVMTALRPALTNGDVKAGKDYDELVPVLLKEFSASKSSLIDEMAMIYAKSFTAAELRELAAFYNTPTGQKLARLTPAMSQQMMVAGQRYGQQAAAQIAERMKDELRKRGNKI